MTKKRNWLGILAMGLIFGMMVIGCGGDSGENPNNNNNNSTPLTGTVTVSSNVTVNTINGVESMTLTADTTTLNDSDYLFYKWQREGVDITGETSKTYNVVEADYGKILKVIVSSSIYTGEQAGQITVTSPKIMNVSVKYNGSTNSAGRKRVFFERTDGTGLGSTSASLGTTAENITLKSWNATQFKMRIDFTFIDDKYYFKKPSTDVETFDLTSGTKSYTLNFDYNTSAAGYYSNLTATEE
jgi:hypothetical protein